MMTATAVLKPLPKLKGFGIFLKPDVSFDKLDDDLSKLKDENAAAFVAAKLIGCLHAEVLNAIGAVSDKTDKALHTIVVNLDYVKLKNAVGGNLANV